MSGDVRRCLDLFSGVGGAGVGYQRAGLVVYGIDLHPQPNCPYPVWQGDATLALVRLLAGGSLPFTHPTTGAVEWLALADFVVIHASPPCQDYTTLKAVHGNDWPRLIAPTRWLLQRTGLPFVIENVAGARRELLDPVRLCGEMFGLAVIRHRYFELGGWAMPEPAHPRHRGRVAGMRHGQWFEGPYFAVYGNGGGKGTVPQWQAALGIDWTTDRRELAEAIPPAYTELIGHALAAAIDGQAVA